MPCYDHRSSAGWLEEHTVQPLKKQVDQYAVWLCHLLSGFSDDHVADLPDDLGKWWDEHRAFDHDRDPEGQQRD